MSHPDDQKRETNDNKAADEHASAVTTEQKITSIGQAGLALVKGLSTQGGQAGEEWDQKLACVRQAQQHAAACDFAQAEQLLLQIGEIDNAIMMYQKCRDFNAVIRLVSQYRPNWLLKMHLAIAKQLEGEGDYPRAEHHYVEGKAWMKAVTMYRERKLEAEADRVAKAHAEQGTDSTKENAAKNGQTTEGAPIEADKEKKLACLQRAQQLALAHDYAQAEQLLLQVGESDKAITMYKKCRDFSAVIRLVSKYRPDRLQQTHLALGQQLESEGNYHLAEHHYVEAKGGRPLICTARRG